jgi:hypothetical protein
MASEPVIAHEFELGHRGFVRATLDTFKGRQFASLRLWVEPRDQPGAPLIPTAKGLTVPVEYIAELVQAAQALAERKVADGQTRRAA